MTEKKLEEVTIKMGPVMKRRLSALAEADGTTVSELIRHLIDTHIAEKERHYLAMHSIFSQGEE